MPETLRFEVRIFPMNENSTKSFRESAQSFRNLSAFSRCLNWPKEIPEYLFRPYHVDDEGAGPAVQQGLLLLHIPA
jgi:hypothetical protein